MSAVLLADVKEHLGITTSAHDAELQAMSDRAEAALASRVGPLEPVVVTAEVHTGPGPLLLRRWPVLTVTSATSGDVAVADLDLDPDAGLLYGSFNTVRRNTTVTYTAGRQVLPADLEMAVLELVRHMWESQLGNSPASLSSGDPDERTLQGISNYLLPYRVQTLIEPHQLPPAIA